MNLKPCNYEIQKRHRTRASWKWWLTGILIFVCGMIIGGVGSLAVVHTVIREHYECQEIVLSHVMNRLQRKLDLDNEQRIKVKQILKQRFAALRQIRDETVPCVKYELELLQKQIAAELNEQQKKKLDKHCRHIRRKLHLHRKK